MKLLQGEGKVWKERETTMKLRELERGGDKRLKMRATELHVSYIRYYPLNLKMRGETWHKLGQVGSWSAGLIWAVGSQDLMVAERAISQPLLSVGGSYIA